MDVDVTFRQIDASVQKPHMDNSYRFIVEPENTADYVYIGDVDILILQNILSVHMPVFENGMPYSNIIRTGTKRLSGLHLARYEDQYPLGPIDDLVKDIRNDEELLYAIMQRKGLLRLDDEANQNVGRPVHGIHISLNRLPFSHGPERPDWGLNYIWLEKYNRIAQSESYRGLIDTLYDGPRRILLNIHYFSKIAMLQGKEKFGSFEF